MDAQMGDERAYILWGADSQTCGMCGKAVEAGAADDERWLIDALPNGDGTIRADIRCPRSWSATNAARCPVAGFAGNKLAGMK